MTSNHHVRKWSELEERLLNEMRERMENEISLCPPFPEVIGDRRMIRFLRGCGHDVNKAVEVMSKFLKWRRANKIDDIRQDIVYGGKNDPRLFPFGEQILSYFPQIVLTASARDKQHNPISIEHYSFSPKEILKNVSFDQYVQFLQYCLEYKMLILEQLSYEREQEILSNPELLNNTEAYGQIMRICIFRDIKGFNREHLSSDAKKIVTETLKIAKENYTELLYKSHIVNAPFIFNLFWMFMKSLLDSNTVAKVAIYSTDFYDSIVKEISHENLSERFGGGFTGDNEAFIFNVTPGGPLHYPGAPETGASHSATPEARPSQLQSSSETDDDLIAGNNGASHEMRRGTEGMPVISKSQNDQNLRNEMTTSDNNYHNPSKYQQQQQHNFNYTNEKLSIQQSFLSSASTSSKGMTATADSPAATTAQGATGGRKKRNRNILRSIFRVLISPFIEACLKHPFAFIVVLPLVLWFIGSVSISVLIIPVLSVIWLFFVITICDVVTPEST